MNRFCRPLVLMLMVGMVPAISQAQTTKLAIASCSKTGTIVKVAMSTIGESHVLYLREDVFDSFYFYALTDVDELAALAGTLAALQTRVRIKTSSATCPADPTTGGVSLGTVWQLDVAP